MRLRECKRRLGALGYRNLHVREGADLLEPDGTMLICTARPADRTRSSFATIVRLPDRGSKARGHAFEQVLRATTEAHFQQYPEAAA